MALPRWGCGDGDTGTGWGHLLPPRPCSIHGGAARAQWGGQGGGKQDGDSPTELSASSVQCPCCSSVGAQRPLVQ